MFVDPEGVPDTFQDGQAKVEEQVDGMISIPNEDNISAFDIDINRLKIKKWEMTGEESDYFNYGHAVRAEQSGLREYHSAAPWPRASG